MIGAGPEICFTYPFWVTVLMAMYSDCNKDHIVLNHICIYYPDLHPLACTQLLSSGGIFAVKLTLTMEIFLPRRASARVRQQQSSSSISPLDTAAWYILCSSINSPPLLALHLLSPERYEEPHSMMHALDLGFCNCNSHWLCHYTLYG